MEVTEIFFSIQGESSNAGEPCIFVRLTSCTLRCVYCDTKYAYSGGQDMTVDAVVSAVERYPSRLVEITGGEPLEQPAVYPLMETLLGRGYRVMLETGGHVPIGRVPRAVVKIVDVKCPGSGEAGTICWENLDRVEPHDEFKFVISSRADYEWSKAFYLEHLWAKPNAVLFAPSHDTLPAVELAGWILDDGLPVRLQLQIHKYIWEPSMRGV